MFKFWFNKVLIDITSNILYYTFPKFHDFYMGSYAEAYTYGYDTNIFTILLQYNNLKK